MDIIGVDVGGTFTDLIRFDETTGRISAAKVPSTPRNPAQAFIAGLDALALDPQAIRHLIHGTTVATNAVLERKGATVGLVTTAGFRDLIEIGRTQRMLEGGMFNPRFVRPKPLVARARRFEVRERLLADGSVLTSLDEDDVASVAAELRSAGVEAVAVCFLHSYRNPAHEQRAGQLLRAALPGVFVSISAEVVPEYREFERFSTTVLNSYVSPIMGRYLAALDRELAEQGYAARVFTMSSNGGILTSERAGAEAVLTILSGPVGGVNGSIAVARAAGLRNLITYDMGGTSTDVCLVHDLAPVVSTENVLAGFPVKTPQVNINTVGAGGGSIAWLDGGELQVGPRSAGADPGPASYGQGGSEPTVTDANLVLGRIDPDRVLGGAIRLQPKLAEEVIQALAAKLGGLDLHRLADGIVRIAVARMTSSIREISVQRGYDPRDFVLVAFGGAGPMHATHIAEELAITHVLIPRYPGNLSAFGLLTSDLKHDYVRTFLRRLSAVAPADFAAQFAALEEIARQQLRADGVAPADVSFVRSLDLRYLGQAYELNVQLPEDGYAIAPIRRAFYDRYLATYGHASEDEEVQVVNVRLAALGRVPKPIVQPLAQTGTLDGARLGVRQVYFGDRFWNTPLYERDLLPTGVRFAGPAIIEEAGATTVVTPGWRLEVDAFGNLVLES
ncbi:MAG: hydantoinase/oxoprolinase family protein [Chloroflexi bacterium]|nr:hydantoinase/oxoprolinase family protein [Chloroflexota bacterium]